jgi:hypothetical protein
MTILKDKHIKKFQEIYKARFGIDLTYDEASEKGTKLYRLMNLIYKPMTKEESETVKARQKYIADKFRNHES